MFWITLALKSLINRRLSVGLTALSIALSVALVLSVEKIRIDTKDNFARTLTGTDLVVGARTGALNLLLYSVFRIGNASNNVSWESYQELDERPEVAWSVPLSLGDAHRGYRVIGTTAAYFDHYQYGRGNALELAAGQSLESLFDVVIGSEVAARLGYEVGTRVVVSHGTGDVSFSEHDDLPFTVTGVLAPTGTPVDRSLHVSLQAIEAIHVGWTNGVKQSGAAGFDANNTSMHSELQPTTITAALFGMRSRLKTFAFQRAVNDYRAEPLMAIIPGATLQELWSISGVLEDTLMVISMLVAISGLLGLLTVILAGLNERRREMALLRSLGAPATRVFGLLCAEAGLMAAVGVVLGVVLHYIVIVAAAPMALERFGVHLEFTGVSLQHIGWLCGFVVVAAAFGLFPALRAYRQSLSDGLSQRV